MKWFKQCQTLEELKKLYKELIMKYHPDRGGDNATMAQINAEYDKVFVILQNSPKNTDKTKNTKTEQKECVNEFKDLINQMIHMKGLIIEICGTWVWVSGNTYPNRVMLDKLNFKWCKSKKMWYKAPEGTDFHRTRGVPMDQIRNKYGSTKFESEEAQAIG